jgi:biopolymer transport protein ExbD
MRQRSRLAKSHTHSSSDTMTADFLFNLLVVFLFLVNANVVSLSSTAADAEKSSVERKSILLWLKQDGSIRWGNKSAAPIPIDAVIARLTNRKEDQQSVTLCFPERMEAGTVFGIMHKLHSVAPVIHQTPYRVTNQYSNHGRPE